MSFSLHPALAAKSFICDLPFCRVLLEDNRHYPWILLVPRKVDVKNLLGLSLEERSTLMQEMAVCEKTLWDLFHPTQINVAAIGNITPQLHIHIICRYDNDPAWPHTVWGRQTEKYPIEEKQALVQKLAQRISL